MTFALGSVTEAGLPLALTLQPGVDLFPLLAAVLAALTCGLLGNFLILRRMSLMGDAMSHSVLPGLVIAFLITGTRSPIAMFAGAAIAGLVTVVLVEVVKRLGRLDAGASMGVVFSLMFALGVLLIEQAARQVDLDADCVLHGDLEGLVWYSAPDRWRDVWHVDTLRALPSSVVVLLVMGLATVTLVTVLFKELRLAAFDPALATTQGFHAGGLHLLLMGFVAAATVAAFEAVGSILVIAMLIAPAATARLLTDRVLPQVLVSAVAAIVAAVGGYVGAAAIPAAFGIDAVNAAGAMAVACGALLVGAIVAGPRHGVVAKGLRRRRLARSIGLEDLLAALYRAEEETADDHRGAPETPAPGLDRSAVQTLLRGHHPMAAIRTARSRGLVDVADDRIRLTDDGRHRAAGLIRRHRLWEHYLVDEAGVPADHVHESAHRLEHVPPVPRDGPPLDPHGRGIPPADEDG